MQVLQPRGWPRPKGYANGVVAQGQLIVLAGMIGWNEQEQFESDDLVEQIRQALRNIRTLLHEAGAEPKHLVRLTWYLVDMDGFRARGREIGAAYRKVLGREFPPMAAVGVSSLVERRAKVEIEATAVIPARTTVELVAPAPARPGRAEFEPVISTRPRPEFSVVAPRPRSTKLFDRE